MFGNRVNYFSIQQAHSELEVSAISEVEVGDANLVPPLAETPAWEQVRDSCVKSATRPPSPHASSRCRRRRSRRRRALAYARSRSRRDDPFSRRPMDLMSRIFTEFEYDPAFTTVATPLATALEHRRGVCQDFAHVGIACLRGLGLPARYVSGYLETLPPPGQPKLRGADASHAWFSVFVPGLTQTGLLGRLRPDQRLPDPRATHHHRHRSRLSGRDPGARRLLRRRRASVDGRGGRRPALPTNPISFGIRCAKTADRMVAGSAFTFAMSPN
jgi:transglutaminase-like putative cysteine protease